MTAFDVAELVADALNESGLLSSLSAEVLALPEFQLDEMGTMHVTVVPVAFGPFEMISRGQDISDCSMEISIQQRVSNIESDTRELCSFVQQIAQYLTRKNLGNRAACWRSTMIEPLYDSESLREKRLFVSVIRLVYEVEQ
jgi:hypothetical protein